MSDPAATREGEGSSSPEGPEAASAVRSLHGSRMRLGYEARFTALVLLSGAPAIVIGLLFLWHWEQAPHVRFTVFLLLVLPWVLVALAARDRVLRTFQTLSNILAALREGDFSLRGKTRNPDDALGEVMAEVNQLAELLQVQRLGAVEATALLGRVMEVIEVAIFTFDPAGRLRFVNRAGQQLLDAPEARLMGRSAESLGLDSCLDAMGDRTMDLRFPSASGRWGVSTTRFREDGLPHDLVAIQDLTRALRDEEIATWKRLVRVLGHELNNSLAPIKSIAGSVQTLVRREPRPDDWEEDALRGLEIIASRADSLSRFMSNYARLAKLPPPVLARLDLPQLVRRVAALERRLPVDVRGGPPVELRADGDQLEQVLINLIRNAVDASLETGGGVCIAWERERDYAVLRIVDEGPGIANPDNLFVPFFTTKPGGSGIGLVLCRQIAEAHGGSLRLTNRTEAAQGSVAVLQIPIET